MRKLILSLAALSALTLAVPYAAPANADTVVVKHGGGWHPHRRVYNETVTTPAPAGEAVITRHHPRVQSKVVIKNRY